MHDKDMIDLGQKASETGPCQAPAKESKNKVYYPTFYIRSKDKIDLPDGEFYFSAKARKISSEERQRDGEEPSYSCELEVKAIRPEGAVESEDDDVDTGMASMEEAFGKAFRKGAKNKKAGKKLDEDYEEEA